MPRTQLLLAVLTPTLAVPVGIMLNRSGYSKLEAHMGAMENCLDSRVTALESRFRADMLMVIG